MGPRGKMKQSIILQTKHCRLCGEVIATAIINRHSKSRKNRCEVPVQLSRRF